MRSIEHAVDKFAKEHGLRLNGGSAVTLIVLNAEVKDVPVRLSSLAPQLFDMECPVEQEKPLRVNLELYQMEQDP